MKESTQEMKVTSASKLAFGSAAIWVNGHGTKFDNTIQGAIYNMQRDAARAALELESCADSFSKKTRRGREYWYRWHTEKGWVYICPVAKGDPRIEYREDARAIREQISEKKKLMQSCVIKRLGQRHLLINIDTYKKHVAGALPGDSIKLTEVVR